MMNVNRVMFPGLATGLDTNQIIKDLMRVERMPLERLQQKRQILEWQREDYREMNLKLAAFRTKIDGMRLQSGFMKRTIASTDEAALTGSVVGVPSQSMYSVEVKQLAKAGKHASATLDFGVAHPAQTFAEAIEEGESFEAFTIKINETIAIKVEENDSLESLVTKINEAFVPDVGETDAEKLRAEIVGNRIVIKSTDFETYAEKPLSVNIEGTAPIIRSTHVNAHSQPPQQAEIIINGITLTSDTNRFTYDGLQIDAKQLTEGKTVNLTVGRDVDAIFDQVKQFVEAYNELIAEVNQKLGERRYRDYPPLTDEERDFLTDSEIEKWEERARSGLIKNDPLLRGVLSDFRMDFYTQVEGVGHLSEIGITVGTGYLSYQEGGKLHIDEDKLRTAISENPDLVVGLFTNSGQSADESARYKETGIGKRLYDSVERAIKQLNAKAGYPVSLSEADNSTIGKQLRNMDEDIYNMERRLLQVEERYWREFTALERAMERLNQQNAWLMSQLDAM